MFLSTKFLQVFVLQAMDMQLLGMRLKQWEVNSSRYVVHGFISVESEAIVFPINAHQNVNQKPIGSAPAYWAQCTLPPQSIYQTSVSIC